MMKAVQSLNDRLSVLHRYLSDVQRGVIRGDPQTLRDIKGLCQRLPVMQKEAFSADLLAVRKRNDGEDKRGHVHVSEASVSFVLLLLLLSSLFFSGVQRCASRHLSVIDHTSDSTRC